MRHRKEEKEEEEEEEVNGVRTVPRAWNPSTQTSNGVKVASLRECKT